MVPICGQPWRTFENWPTIPSSKRSCTKSRCSGKRWRSRNHFKRIDGRLRSIPVGYRPTEQLIQRHQPCGDFLCLADRQLLTEVLSVALDVFADGLVAQLHAGARTAASLSAWQAIGRASWGGRVG